MTEDDLYEDAEEQFAGSELETKYLEVVQPTNDPTRYGLEFKIQFFESGSFFVQIAYETENGMTKFTEPQYINVEPVMSLRGKNIRSKELNLMTVMSRCLGKMDRWPQVIQNQKELGYNAIHFTPFAKYGESFSHYSIAD